jgi:hypothetical protein
LRYGIGAILRIGEAKKRVKAEFAVILTLVIQGKWNNECLPSKYGSEINQSIVAAVGHREILRNAVNSSEVLFREWRCR